MSYATSRQAASRVSSARRRYVSTTPPIARVTTATNRVGMSKTLLAVVMIFPNPARPEQLADDDPDESATDRQPHPGDDERRRGRDRHSSEDPGRRRAKRPSDGQQAAIGRLEPGLRIDDHREDDHHEDDRDLRRDADAEPDDDDRRKRDHRRGVEPGDPGLEEVAYALPRRHRGTDRDPGDRAEDEA